MKKTIMVLILISAIEFSQGHINNSIQPSTMLHNVSDVNYLLGKYDPEDFEDFVIISREYTEKDGIYLRREVYEAYKNMYNAAMREGIKLNLISATRNFEYQKGIWEEKWQKLNNDKNCKGLSDREKVLKILKYSAMPGASRHHWGTDIDICDLNDGYYLTEKGKRTYEWLTRNADKYGFCQTYTKFGESRSTGYYEEKWHWSYQPMAMVFTRKAQEILSNTMFEGFSGCEQAEQINILENYILGINKDCL